MTAGPPPPELKTPPAVRRPQPVGLSALDMIDEAALRLRLAPVGTLGIYYAGSLPFVLALLYFWTDMRRNADAARDAAGASLGMAALFVGMKVAQAVFAARLRAQFARRPPVRWTRARLARLTLVQALLQPSGLFLLPLAAVLTVPLGWVYAFYGNVTALGDGETASAQAVLTRAARAALRDPKGNHLALSIFSLLGLFAWLNLVLATLLLPQLAQMFTGEENVFTRSGLHVFNSTFFAVTSSLVYLALDPLVKTFYALRCFHDDAQRTGEDLKSGLRALPAPDTGVGNGAGTTGRAAGPTALLAVACVAFSVAPVSAAAPTAAMPPAAARGAAPAVDTVSAPALGRSVDEVLRRREFAWRAPRPPTPPAPDQAGPVGRFFAGVRAWFAHGWEWASGAARALADRVRHWWRSTSDAPDEPSPSTGGLDAATLRLLIYGLTVLIAGLLTLLAWKSWRARRTGTLTGEAVPAAPSATPDLADEGVLATRLPEDEWLRMARDLVTRGERRLALRAFYLSTLAGLDTRGLLAIARHKSNRDYLGELRRRAPGRAAVPEAFARNVGRLERVWYGPHPADDALLAEFEADRERTLAC